MAISSLGTMLSPESELRNQPSIDLAGSFRERHPCSQIASRPTVRVASSCMISGPLTSSIVGSPTFTDISSMTPAPRSVTVPLTMARQRTTRLCCNNAAFGSDAGMVNENVPAASSRGVCSQFVAVVIGPLPSLLPSLVSMSIQNSITPTHR